MHFYTALAVAVLGLANLVASQTIDPDSVPIATREVWCNSQVTSCPLLCSQITPSASTATDENSCSASDLTFLCVCSNGQQPNASNYSQTIPYFECTEYATQCVNACSTTNTSCQSACRTNNLCGAQNPTRVNTSTSSTMSATATSDTADSTGSGIYTGFGGPDPTATETTKSSNANSIAIHIGHAYGLILVLGSFFGGFAFML
ncbi:hypothetical protein MMC12_005015 [Toensbergia leucococca]|nr:hypothetical protein [Toensbergia leucococca]